MAEFALGLTKTAVDGTLSRVKSAIEEEAKLKVRVENDLLFITGEFQMMRSFLNAANAERAKNDVVRTWVRQVRDLAFDVEDCVEFVVHLDKGSPWTNWFWRVLPSCIAPSLPLDEAVAEIKQLKARVEDVSQRNTRYNLISDSGYSSKHPVSVSSLVPELMPASTKVCATADAFNALCKVWESSGKLRDMDDLCKLINREGGDLEVISLWQSPGAGHLGVTHVIKEAYNDHEISREFKSKAWIKLVHPFNPDEFLKSLLTQIYASSCHQANIGAVDFQKKMKEEATEDELMKQLSDQRYLVIVEELSTVVEWDVIKMYLPKSKNGSRIVVATQQLGLALYCTGDPYQVSIIKQLSDGQSLCAFFNKVSGRRSDMSELIWQLRRPGVVSVWNDDSSSKSTLIDKVYTCITHKSKEFDAVGFERHVWVDVPYKFDLMVFARRLLLSFHSDDFHGKEIAAVSMMGDQEIIKRCCSFLRDDYCLIVIGGLKWTKDWDRIKSAFLSDPIKGSIIVLTDGLYLARYCVHEECGVFNIKDLDADPILQFSMKDYDNYRFGGREDSCRGHVFYNRREKASDWTNKFQHIGCQYYDYYGLMTSQIGNGGVISLWGTPDAGAGRSSLVRRIYYNQLLIERGIPQPYNGDDDENRNLEFRKFSWIEVPHPFDLTNLCWRLLLDFYSDGEKEGVAEDLMYGRHDPVEGCRMILRQYKCFVVARGLQSTHDWDLMREALLCEPISGCIVVITNEESVATYCAHQYNCPRISEERKDSRVWHIVTGDSESKGDCYDVGYQARNNRRCIFSSRMEEAREWFKKFELIGHRNELQRLQYKLGFRDSHVISVWGIAGVGKSDVVRSMYYPSMIGIKGYSKGCLQQVTKYSWVDVPHPFDLTELSRRLLMDFHWDDLAAKEATIIRMMEGQDSIQECRKLLHQDCFVVIRGLLSIDDWDLIKVALLPEHVKGCILIITNEENVATHFAHRKDGVVNVKGLDSTAAHDLFRKIIQDDKLLVSNEAVEFQNLILAKCGGLPKVITAIATYWKNKPTKNLLDNTGDGFMTLLETGPSSRGLEGLFCWMRSYFDACSDSLKPCIFYLSVFPASQNIRQKRLLRRWIAEGYSRDTPGSSAQENGERLFTELVGLSILQPLTLDNSIITNQSVDVCQVNGFFREYIISRPMEDNLVFALDGRCSLNTQRAGQHLTISRSWDRDEIVFKSMDFLRLRSLTVFGEWRSFFISKDVNMKLLRVLDLEDTSDLRDGDIEQIGKLLPRLKFLSLRGCIYITRLPDSLGDMRQLQTLDIKNTAILTLPVAIIKLHKLQHMHCGTSHQPCGAGDGIVLIQPEVGEELPSTSTEDGYGNATATSKPPAEATTSLPPTEATTSLQPVEAITPRKSWPHALVPSWLSKSRKEGFVRGTNHNGVKVVPAAAEGIWKLTALQTFGVVNVGSASGGIIVLRELKKLTQLRKLRLSGINLKNWNDFCSAISGHGYLESLSVRLDDDPTSAVTFANFSDISEPPKTLKTLKVFGKNTHISVVWIKQLHNLTKVDLELSVSTQRDIDTTEELACRGGFRLICLRPIEDGSLTFGQGAECVRDGLCLNLKVLKIDCRYSLDICFQHDVYASVEFVVVHCPTAGSSLEYIGLGSLRSLKEVWLTGSYSNEMKRHLQKEVAKHEKRPVLKLEAQPRRT